MLNDKVKLELRGDIQLDIFVEAVKHFYELVAALSSEIAGKESVEWGLDTLEYGSPALMTWQGHADADDIVEGVVIAVENVGRSLERGGAIPYGQQIRDIALKLAKIPNGRIDTLLLGSEQNVATITHASTAGIDEYAIPSEISSYGQVIGRAETVSVHSGNVVTIYDELFRKGVRCYFGDEDKSRIQNMLGKRVSVSGYVTRDTYSGRPRSIREINDVEYLPEPDSQAFLALEGVFSFRKGDEASEVTIRRLRDAF